MKLLFSTLKIDKYIIYIALKDELSSIKKVIYFN